MTDYGETSAGFRGKTFAEAGADLRTRLRSKISESLTLDEKDWLGNAVDAHADIEALVWEALEVARNAFDPDNAEGASAVALASLTGTFRKQPTKGTVLCGLTLAASKTFAPGALVAHVVGQPDNRWVNRDTVTSTTAGWYPGRVFVAETAGAYTALTGTLTVIAQTVSGWTAITNTTDATPGTDLESIPDMMARREQELTAGGNATVSAIDEKVGEVAGVTEVKVFYNDTNATIGVLPAHNIHVLIWDALTTDADDDDVAQAIFDSKSAGAPTYGASSGDAVDVYGTTVICNFDRAVPFNAYIAVTVQCPLGTNVSNMQAEVTASIQALWPNRIGVSAYVNKLIAGPASIEQVTTVIAMTIGNAPAPIGSSLTAFPTTILLLDSANIAVTVNIV